MSSIDRVYGVTMAQKGISDLVSVDFDKIDLEKKAILDAKICEDFATF